VTSAEFDVLAVLKPGGAFHVDYHDLLAASDPARVQETFARAIEGEWSWLYEHETRRVRDLRATTIGNFTWLLDATDSPQAWEADNRLIGVYGTSSRPVRSRDKSRLAGFPSPTRYRPGRVHRGHAVGHSLGGPDEGYNLFTQNAAVNLGREWRALERYCAARPSTFMFIRAIYLDITSMPAALEYGLIREDGSLDVHQFDNRS
jgi:hypothetical protein